MEYDIYLRKADQTVVEHTRTKDPVRALDIFFALCDREDLVGKSMEATVSSHDEGIARHRFA